MTKMTTTPNLLHRTVAIAAAAITMASTAQAEITNIKEALAAALKNETIAAAGDKMKLYSLSANYKGNTKRWSFQFYDGGANVHSIYMDKSGKARYSARNKGSLRIFDDLDFSKLPAPTEVLIDNVAAKAKEVLIALKFKPVENGKLYISYSLRSEFRQKDKPAHFWNVTIPIGDGKKGKLISFKNGQLDTMMNATIY